MDDIFTVTWDIDDGYAGKARPHHFGITADNIDVDMDEIELRRLFNEQLEQEFEKRISYYSSDEDAFVEWAGDMNTKDKQEDTKILINLLLIKMQEKNIWPYKKRLGENPKRATTEEVFAIRDNFVEGLET